MTSKTIVTWNIRHGGGNGERSSAIVAQLSAFDVDILVGPAEDRSQPPHRSVSSYLSDLQLPGFRWVSAWQFPANQWEPSTSLHPSDARIVEIWNHIVTSDGYGGDSPRVGWLKKGIVLEKLKPELRADGLERFLTDQGERRKSFVTFSSLVQSWEALGFVAVERSRLGAVFDISEDGALFLKTIAFCGRLSFLSVSTGAQSLPRYDASGCCVPCPCGTNGK